MNKRYIMARFYNPATEAMKLYPKGEAAFGEIKWLYTCQQITCFFFFLIKFILCEAARGLLAQDLIYYFYV